MSSSSSTSTRSPKTPSHDVFIGSSSCDGTRDSFVSHLLAALRRLNITIVEEDDKNLNQDRKLLLPKITRLAIQRSRVCIVVISENFALSKHSLSMLAEVIEWRHGKPGTAVVPVFYGVSRSVVEQQSGKFEEAFSKYETSEPKDRVTQWRNALKGATQLHEGLESNVAPSDLKLVENIVTYVHERLFPTDKIGINLRVSEIGNLLSKQSLVNRSIGIWGMAGIGKTTIANAVFNQMKGNYKSARFISDFNKEFQEKGMYYLREKRLPQNLKDKLNIDLSITNQSQSQGNDESVFLVLDDVRNPIDAESFLGGFNWFDPGSVLIITSRDKHVLVQCLVQQIYEVKGIDDNEGLKLFSRCALEKAQPEEVYLKISEMVVKYANGNAKALSYYGKELKGKTAEEMETAFHQLKLCPPAEILQLFKSSYDELSDDEKKIFLDIACFFKGEIVDRVMQILEGCGFFPCIGIDYLVEKSLVTLCNNKVEMHNLIQDVAKEILNLEVGVAGRGRRLYDHGSIQPLLRDEENWEDDNLEDIESILLEASDLNFVVNPKAFESMYNLRLLKIYSMNPDKRPGVDLSKDLLTLPSELRLLHWENYSLQFLPKDFDPENLVELNMPYSQLQMLWEEESKNLKSLKRISLHHSEKLVDIKEVSEAHNLHQIDLQGSISLQNIPAIGILNHLEILNLCGCKEIKIFPEVPPNIKELCLNGTGISEVPESIETLSKLVKLDLGNCIELLNFVVKIDKMECLEVLDLSGCAGVKSFPEITNPVRKLKYLHLNGTKIKDLDTSLSNMIALKVLKVNRNFKLPLNFKDLDDSKDRKVEFDEE